MAESASVSILITLAILSVTSAQLNGLITLLGDTTLFVSRLHNLPNTPEATDTRVQQRTANAPVNKAREYPL